MDRISNNRGWQSSRPKTKRQGTRAVKRSTFKSAVAVVVCVAFAVSPALANHDAASKDQPIMIPGIWTDPDGCQHWVMDDGWEGYMTPNVRPNGKPVCGQKQTCAIVETDQLFATNDFALSDRARRALLAFFKNSRAKAFKIEGHTDSHASDAYNIELSLNRARAVSAVATGAGYKVQQIAGYGERQPKVSNATAAGRAQNRRVEIECVY